MQRRLLLLTVLLLGCATARRVPPELQDERLSTGLRPGVEEARVRVPDLEARWAAEVAEGRAPIPLASNLILAWDAAGSSAEILALHEQLPPTALGGAPSVERAWLLKTVAERHEGAGQAGACADLASRSSREFQSLGDTSAQALAGSLAARCLLAAQGPAAARRAAEEALGAAGATPGAALAVARATWGLWAVRSGQIEAGLAAATRAVGEVGIAGDADRMTALWVAAQTASAASTPQLRAEWMERAAPLAALDPHRETRVAFGLDLSVARLSVGDARGAFAALAEVEVEGDPSVAPEALGERWLAIGEAALGRGDLALAAQSLGNASRACDGAQAHACVGRAEEGLGAEALRRGAVAEARSHLLRAALAHESAGDGAAAVRCLGAAAEHSLALERFEAAEEDFAQALQSAGDLSGPQIGALHAGRAYALLRLGRQEEASASARFALLSREPRDLARAHLVLGTVALERGQGEIALSELTLALQAGDVGLSAELGWRVIVAAGLAGTWDVVLSRAQTALAAAPAQERRAVLDAISAAHLATQTPGDARAWHLALLSEARAAEDDAAEIVALLGVGLAHLGEDHVVEAGAVLEQALDLANGRGEDMDKGAALVALARVSAAQGRPPEAQALARRALALLTGPEARWRRRAAEAFVADLEALAEPTPPGAVN